MWYVQMYDYKYLSIKCDQLKRCLEGHKLSSIGYDLEKKYTTKIYVGDYK